MSANVDFKHAQKRLALLWFPWSGILFLVVFLQSIFGRYGEDVAQAWEWLLPTIVPTLSLIIGVFVVQAKGQGQEGRSVERFTYLLTFWVSAFYLLLVSLTILLGPVAESLGSASPLQLMSRSHLWLAPCQGLAVASLGAFFFNVDSQPAVDAGEE